MSKKDKSDTPPVAPRAQSGPAGMRGLGKKRETVPAATAAAAEPAEPEAAVFVDPGLEERAATGRETAWKTGGGVGLVWHGVPLEPFSMGREALWLEIRQALKAARLTDVMSGDMPRAFLGDAIRIVWLCLQPFRSSEGRKGLVEWRHDAVAMQAAIDEWAETEVRDDAAAVTLLGLTLFNHAEIGRAVAMPLHGNGVQGGPGGGDGLGE